MLPERQVRVAACQLRRTALTCSSDSLQAEAQPRRHHHPHCGLQRRDRHLQERQVQRLGKSRDTRDAEMRGTDDRALGCRRSGQDSASVAALLFRFVRPTGVLNALLTLMQVRRV